MNRTSEHNRIYLQHCGEVGALLVDNAGLVGTWVESSLLSIRAGQVFIFRTYYLVLLVPFRNSKEDIDNLCGVDVNMHEQYPSIEMEGISPASS
ncbi:MAG: hypothetical protein ABR985_12195 [Methanotrichaceae archaeon]